LRVIEEKAVVVEWLLSVKWERVEGLEVGGVELQKARKD
jgi:hypothetical protein